jgi:hypothetical protein
MTRYRARFYDPTGARHGGMPTWPWRSAPEHLLTRRQLTARGLRPGGQPVCGQVLWARRGKTATAYLYDVALAKPKRAASPRQLAALDKALAAQRRCPTCGEDAGYRIPTCLGECVECHDAATTRLRAQATGREWAA